MSRAADDDLTAFNEIDACLARIHADVAAAAQDGPGVALHDFDVKGTLHGNGFALDCADGVVGRFVGASGGRGPERKTGKNDRHSARIQSCRASGARQSDNLTKPTPDATTPPHPKKPTRVAHPAQP